MPFSLATAPGKAGRENEDFAAATANAAVLLDGATTPPGAETGCVHGVAWYARTLGGLLLGKLAGQQSLSEALAAGIEEVRAMHADTCDLVHAQTPSSTVVAIRRDTDRLEYLVLADSVLLLDRVGENPHAITDDRADGVNRALRADMDALATGTPEHAAAWRAYVAAVGARRNRPGGFWVANTDPAAAKEALTGSVPLHSLSAVALLSDGASRLADRFHLTTWRETLDVLADGGPEALLRQVRHAEATDPDGRRWPRGKASDDATALYWPIND